jgi:hypothetical protein
MRSRSSRSSSPTTRPLALPLPLVPALALALALALTLALTPGPTARQETIVYNTLADLMGGMGAAPASGGKSGVLGGGGGRASQGAVMTGSKQKVPLGRVVKPMSILLVYYSW